MTDQDILQKSTEKAIKNGYFLNNVDIDEVDFKESVKDKSYMIIIFSHDFAKAFWKGSINEGSGDEDIFEPWEYHLREMVLEENPIEYLERFI